MTLAFDARMNLQGQPGVHALIAGVSAYPHLPGGSGVRTADSFGMQQLSSTALSAYRIYEWLIKRQSKLPLPLATCRLLLSPSQQELSTESKLADLAEPCTLQNFQRAAKSWRGDAGTHNENIAFFYFAGHGVQRSKGDAVLLLEDFGDDTGGILAKAVNTKNIYYGMTKSANKPTMAQTQFYFIDACRVLPSKFKDFERLETSSVWDVELSGRDDRRAPIFYSAVPGTKAYALKGEHTLFCKALLECLNGGAGELVDVNGQEEWWVSYQSLSAALGDYLRQLNINERVPPDLEQEFTVDGFGQNDARIHQLDGPPSAEILLELEPPTAASYAKVEVIDDNGNPVWTLPPPLTPHPYRAMLQAGIYRVGARFNPSHPNYVDRNPKSYFVKPPVATWKLQVKS